MFFGDRHGPKIKLPIKLKRWTFIYKTLSALPHVHSKPNTKYSVSVATGWGSVYRYQCGSVYNFHWLNVDAELIIICDLSVYSPMYNGSLEALHSEAYFYVIIVSGIGCLPHRIRSIAICIDFFFLWWERVCSNRIWTWRDRNCGLQMSGFLSSYHHINRHIDSWIMMTIIIIIIIIIMITNDNDSKIYMIMIW